MDDPSLLALAHVKELFSIPDEARERIQLAGMRRRFSELRTRVPMLDRLADEQGIREIGSVEDVVPLLFPHTFYKSYPLSHIDRNRYDRLTGWLQGLTSFDLSQLRVAGCETLEGWMDRIEDATPIQCLTTSGTTGKVSFLPRARIEWKRCAIGYFLRYFQGFHGEANQDLSVEDFRDVPLFFPNFRHGRHTQHRIVEHMVELYYGGDASMVMALYPGRMDLDVLSLAGRLAAAEGRGETLAIPPALKAKREQFAAQQRAMPENVKTFFARLLEQHAGKRITTFCPWSSLYDCAAEALAEGRTHVFSPDSLILSGGGFKGRTLPPNWYEMICEFLGVPEVRDGYGMSEQIFNTRRCDFNRYHCQPANVTFLLDPDTGVPLPREGTQTGRYAFVDLLAETYWGGFVSGDELTITWSHDCECGRKGPYAHREVRRYHEKRGGDDKINCAGVPQAHQRALDFIVNA